jgi:hypothetical protein
VHCAPTLTTTLYKRLIMYLVDDLNMTANMAFVRTLVRHHQPRHIILRLLTTVLLTEYMDVLVYLMNLTEPLEYMTLKLPKRFMLFIVKT